MNRAKGGRHTRNHFLDKWLKEFGWLQMRGSGDDLLIICQDSTKAGKKLEHFHGWMQKFPTIGTCMSHESDGSQK